MNVNTVNFANFQGISSIKQSSTEQLKNAENSTKNITLANMPSFCANKPLTENQKCRKMLLDARTEKGKMRFITKDEINMMSKAIKNFKTEVSKTELLKSLLTYKEYDEVNISYLSAEHIAKYFKLMSGKPGDTQRYFAKELGESIPRTANAQLNLLSSGKVTTKDFEYINKNLEGDDNQRAIKFAFLFDYLRDCPDLINYRKIVIDKMNIDSDSTTLDVIGTLAGCGLPENRNAKHIANVLSAMNENNVDEMRQFADYMKSAYHVDKLFALINKDNFDYAFEALHHECVHDVAKDLFLIKQNGIKLPTKEGFFDGDSYYSTVNDMIYPTPDEDVEE